jgi:hypothetical protein
MRETETSGEMVRSSSMTLQRTLRLSAVVLGIGLLMACGVARAQEDEDEDKSFEEKIIEGLMSSIGGKNMDNRGIDYRERSPLVVPPKLDLPPPATNAEVKAPNWPKDPDEARRKAAIAAHKKENKDPMQSARALSPSELNVGRPGAPARTSNDTAQPGNQANSAAPLSPSQLGYNGSLSNLFGGTKPEIEQFKGEPTRETLTQPPPGYQTPSPNFAYGVGPKDTMAKEYNPYAGKYGD